MLHFEIRILTIILTEGGDYYQHLTVIDLRPSRSNKEQSDDWPSIKARFMLMSCQHQVTHYITLSRPVNIMKTYLLANYQGDISYYYIVHILQTWNSSPNIATFRMKFLLYGCETWSLSLREGNR